MSAQKRPLSLLDVSCVGINTIVGSSIFLFPGKLAGFMGPASVLAFALTGLLLTSVALCFAEASTHFDRAGGSYLYTRTAFGETVGFGIGWMCWTTQVFSWAAVANAIAVYLGFFGERFTGPWLLKGVAAAVILGMGTLNYRGAKLGARTSDFFTAAKLLPLLVFIAAGLPHVRAEAFSPFAPHGLSGVGSACFLAYFAFQGFESVPVPSGEVDRPQKTVPLAVFLSMLIASILYMSIQAVAVGVHPGLAGSERPLAEAAARVLGPVGAAMIVLGAMVSTTGYNSGAALVAPRYLAALAEDGQLPAGLAAPHPVFATPYRSILATTGITLAAALAFDFNKLVDFSNVVVCAQYVATCAAVPALRRLRPPSPGDFRLPGGPAIPALGVLSTLWLGTQGDLKQVGWTIAMLAFGFALRAASLRRSA